jgi:heptosyltransferase-1
MFIGKKMKIAIVKLSAMGDIIHAMVALEFIKKYDSNIKIDWIVEEAFKAILEDNPYIDNILTLNLKSIKSDKLAIFNEIKKVKNYAKNDYDLVIDAQGLIKSAIVSKLLEGKKVAGFSKSSIREKVASWFYDIKVDIAYDANTIDRNAKVLSYPFGFETSQKMIMDKKPFLFFAKDSQVDKFIKKDKKNIVFIIGSTWESRNYPKEHFASITNELDENVLVAWGGEDEKLKSQWIAENSKAIMLPKLSLNSLKYIISSSDLLIGNDTGPTHMAWGLNVPSITIFGPTPISRVYVTSINKVVKSPSIVNPFKLDKNDFSISQIKPKEIIDIAKELLYG